MTKAEKLLQKLTRKPVPKDIKFEEVRICLERLGYEQHTKGKTSGSRVIFIDSQKRVIQLHKSHGSDPIKPKALNYVIESLLDHGHLGEDDE